MAAIRIIVRGRVQGVGFRYFVTRCAEEYDVKGKVWNRRDGGVEAIAEHESEQVLRNFADRLHDGPGRVNSVDFQPEADRGYGDFAIGPTR